MSDNKTKNFSQKGFTRNLLDLMKQLEQNRLCCLNFLEQVYTENTSTITFSGIGTEIDPLSASVNISTSPGNTLSINADGLFAAGVVSADNGITSVDNVVELGQVAGTAGNPAKLLHDTEVPLNGKGMYFSGVGNFVIGANTLISSELFQVIGDQYLQGSLEMPNLGSGGGGGTAMISIDGQPFIHTGLITNSFSTFIGYQAGLQTRTSPNRLQSTVAVGQGALQNYGGGVTTNFRGCALGAFAFQALTAGLADTAFGWATGLNSTNLGESVLLGTGAGVDVNGTNNTFLGTLAGGAGSISATTGGTPTANNTTLVGHLAGGGLSAVDLESVIILGSGSSKTTNSGTLTNTTIIGNSITTDVNNIVLLGASTQNIIVGGAAAVPDNGSRLQIAGSFSLPIRSTAVTTAITNADFTVIFTASATATLSTAATSTNRIYVLVAQGAAVITTSIAYTNLAGASVTSVGAGTSVMIQSNGTSWIQIK